MPPRRLMIIHNVAAGRRNLRALNEFRQALERCGASWSMIEVDTLQGAERAARNADPAAFDAVVAVGGDGTITQIINGLVAATCPLPVAILPLGTANVLARELGLPLDPPAAARLAAFGPTRAIHPGLAMFEGQAPHRFMLMLGVGFDAAVVAGVNPLLKRLIGRAAFVFSIVARLLTFRPAPLHVTIDGETFQAASVIVSRARLYAGNYILAPNANLDGTALIAVLFLQSGFRASVRYGWDLARGQLGNNPAVRMHPADRVSIAGPSESLVQIDGDGIGSLPVTLSVAEQRIEIIAPAR